MGAAWFLINLVEWAYVTALAIHEYRLHGALAVGLIGARFAPAAVLGSLLVGPLSRRSPTAVLRLLSVGRCVAVAGAGAAVAGHAPLAVLVVIVWIDAVISAPYRPVQSAVLPALAGTPQELSAMASSIPASKALAQAAGALAGSLALGSAAPETIAFIGAGVYLVAAALVAPVRPDAGVRLLPAAQSGGPRAAPSSRYGAIGAGFELVGRRARPLLVLGGTRSLSRGLWTALTVVVSIKLLHLGSTGVGELMAAAGVGAAIAVPAAVLFAGRQHLAGPAAFSFALAGIAIVLVGVIASSAPVIVLMILWGVAFALADSISSALIHRVVDARLLTPSVAAIESSKLLLEGLGALLAPALLAVVGIRDAVIIAGAPLPLLALVSRPGLLAIDRRAQARTRLLHVLRGAPLLRGLTMLSLEALAARLQRLPVRLGEAVVREGEMGDRFYLVADGQLEVTIDGFRVAELGPGSSFGEKALLRAAPRSATVTAVSPCELWFLLGPDFVAAATGDEGLVARRVERAGRHSIEEILGEVAMFGAIDRRQLARTGEVVHARAGREIVSQGEPGDTFYALLGGEALVTIDGRSVRTLAVGDWFGEVALLHNVPRTATVTATTDVTLWSLGRDQFLAALRSAAPVDRAATGAVASAGLIV